MTDIKARPVRERARAFLKQCAPHMQKREWYLLITELLDEIPAQGPEHAAQDLLDGFAKGLQGKELQQYARKRL